MDKLRRDGICDMKFSTWRFLLGFTLEKDPWFVITTLGPFSSAKCYSVFISHWYLMPILFQIRPLNKFFPVIINSKLLINSARQSSVWKFFPIIFGILNGNRRGENAVHGVLTGFRLLRSRRRWLRWRRRWKRLKVIQEVRQRRRNSTSATWAWKRTATIFADYSRNSV